MPSIIQFKCRACDGEITIGSEPATQVTCPNCQRPQEVRILSSLQQWRKVTSCIACGHDNLYIQKDFNRQVGVLIVAIGILFSTYFFSRREPVYAMASLVVTAIVDLFIYSIVGMVTVCYSCHAVYRGFEPNPDHELFDLKKLEKYGGRSPRFGA